MECAGTVVEGGDKLACSRHRVLWGLEGKDILCRFARECALDVIHFWDAPEVVHRYLETGDESLMEEARYCTVTRGWDSSSYQASFAMHAAQAAATTSLPWSAARQAVSTAIDALVGKPRVLSNDWRMLRESYNNKLERLVLSAMEAEGNG